MSSSLWHRTGDAIRDRYRRSALAQYGAGLHTDCDDCATGPSDIAVPAPRRGADAGSGHVVDGAQAR